VLEGHALVLGLHPRDLLVVAADVLADQLPDRPLHDPLGLLEAVLQSDGVALGREAAQEVRLEIHEVG
jgi:hypothetical protein